MEPVKHKIVNKNGQDFVEEIYKVVVHRFIVSDTEDPDLLAAEPLWKWQKSEKGQWIMEHALEKPSWHKQIDANCWNYQYCVIAMLEKKKLSEFYLRWGKDGNY